MMFVWWLLRVGRWDKARLKWGLTKRVRALILGNYVLYGADRHTVMNYGNELRLFQKSVKSQRHRGSDHRKSRG